MSYKISYGKDSEKSKKTGKIWRPAIAVLVITLVIMARIIYPEDTKQLTEALFPLTSESAQTALEVFTKNIKAGESFNDSVTAFCLEIIDEANIS